jgi:hypothetical protein
VSKPISELPQFLTDFGLGIVEILQETAENVKSRMSEAGKPVTYPINWDSEKQRRAFFASDGFGGGIPYQRTGQYEASWTVERQPLGAHLAAPSPAAAIGGFPAGWQSRIHRGRWNNLTRVLFEELAKIPDEISNLFQVLGR